jgi:hypothetical protein
LTLPGYLALKEEIEILPRHAMSLQNESSRGHQFKLNFHQMRRSINGSLKINVRNNYN